MIGLELAADPLSVVFMLYRKKCADLLSIQWLDRCLSCGGVEMGAISE